MFRKQRTSLTNSGGINSKSDWLTGVMARVMPLGVASRGWRRGCTYLLRWASDDWRRELMEDRLVWGPPKEKELLREVAGPAVKSHVAAAILVPVGRRHQSPSRKRDGNPGWKGGKNPVFWAQ